MIDYFACLACGAVLPFSATLVERVTDAGWIVCGCGGKMHAVWPEDVSPTPLRDRIAVREADVPMPEPFVDFCAALDMSDLE